MRLAGEAPGAFQFTLTATNPFGWTSTRSFGITILAPSDLMPGFGNGGTVVTAIGTGDDVAAAVGVQADGRIVAAGSSVVAGRKSFSAMRLLPGGAPDPAFGSGGKILPAIGTYGSQVTGLALLPDGRLLLAGYADQDGDTMFAMTRHRADGSLDPDFGSGGKVLSMLGETGSRAYGLALQNDGRMVMAGERQGASTYDFAAARFLPDGRLDATFGSGGWVTTDIGGNTHDYCRCVVVQPDGRVLLGGYATGAADYDFCLVRYRADGSLDPSLGGTGRVRTPVSTHHDFGRRLMLEPDGRILLVGSSDLGDILLVRYLPDGSPDPAFGIGGKVVRRVTTMSNDTYSAARQPDGKLVLTGSLSVGNGGNQEIMTLRLLPNGAPDPSFGSDGLLTTSLGSDDEEGRDIALAPDGSIVAAGFTRHGGTLDYAVLRFAGGAGWTTASRAAWRNYHFGNPADSGEAADGSDPDGDGLINLFEYAFSSDPKAGDAALLGPRPVHAGAGADLRFRCDASRTDLDYVLQASADLGSPLWIEIARSTGGAQTIPVLDRATVRDPGGGVRDVTITPSPALFPHGHGFFRVSIQ
ncbi:hypothetical protein Hsar01_00835 [Haloferula sargassicola]|uniref:Delta-60 repeat domain-containing protein n=2 Tax=Haloferula sargassicola TaxID=490096 RepID=A0ABP9UQN5_9BACT